MWRKLRHRACSRPRRARGFRGRHPNPALHAGGICLTHAPIVRYRCFAARRNAFRRSIPNPVCHRDADSVPPANLHHDLWQPAREHAHRFFRPHPDTDAWALPHANANCHLHAVRDASYQANSVSYAIPNALSHASAHRDSGPVGPIARRHGEQAALRLGDKKRGPREIPRASGRSSSTARRDYLPTAYDSKRGSAPAISTPVS